MEIGLVDRFGAPLSRSLKGARSNGGVHVAMVGTPLEEAVERGNVFAFAAAATVTTQAGLSVTTPAHTVANRIGSGKVVKLWYAGATSLVAAAAGAAVWLAYGRKSGVDVTDAAIALIGDALVR